MTASTVQSYWTTPPRASPIANRIEQGACYTDGMTTIKPDEDAIAGALIDLLKRTPSVSQAELGRRMGVGRSQVNNIVGGKSATKLPGAAAWADALEHRLVIQLLPKRHAPQLEAITDLAVTLSPADLAYLYRLARVLSLYTDAEKVAIEGNLKGMEDYLRASGRLGQKARSA